MTQNNIHTLVRAVIIQDEHVLLCKTCTLENNFHFLPGGHIEPNETAIAALKRELIEEGGKEINIKRFLGCLENYFEPQDKNYCHKQEYNLIFEVSLAIPCDVRAPLKQVEDSIKLVWIPLIDVKQLDIRPQILNSSILEWLSNNDINRFETTMIQQ